MVKWQCNKKLFTDNKAYTQDQIIIKPISIYSENLDANTEEKTVSEDKNIRHQ